VVVKADAWQQVYGIPDLEELCQFLFAVEINFFLYFVLKLLLREDTAVLTI
jgi:hypothetical protein